MKIISLIVTAGGIGQRFNSENPKQFLHINEKSILELALEACCKVELFECIITAPTEYVAKTKKMIQLMNLNCKWQVVEGGASRAESVKHAFEHLNPCDYVLIHDAVRPFVKEETIYSIIDAIDNYDAVIPAISVTDTIKQIEDGLVTQTLPRDTLVAVQTPQAVKYTSYLDALSNFKDKLRTITDDASLIEQNGGRVKVVNGDISNIKITYRSDLK